MLRQKTHINIIQLSEGKGHCPFISVLSSSFLELQIVLWFLIFPFKIFLDSPNLLSSAYVPAQAGFAPDS